MSIGERNRRIEVWKPTGAVDAANQPLPNAWVLHKAKWAHVKGETGMAAIRSAAQSEGINTPLDRYSYRVAYDTSVTVDMQIREHDGSRLNIIGVRHDRANRDWTDIIAEVGGSNG